MSESSEALFRQAYEQERFNARSRDYCNSNLKVMTLWSVYSPSMIFVGSLGSVIILWYGTGEVMTGTLTVGELVAFLSYLALFYEPFTGLDDRSVGVVTARLRELAATGAIVIVATHDLDLAEGLVTRIALIKDGKLLADERASSGLRARYRGVVGSA